MPITPRCKKCRPTAPPESLAGRESTASDDKERPAWAFNSSCSGNLLYYVLVAMFLEPDLKKAMKKKGTR